MPGVGPLPCFITQQTASLLPFSVQTCTALLPFALQDERKEKRHGRRPRRKVLKLIEP